MSDASRGHAAYPPEFLANVDKFIALANEMAKDVDPGVVSAAILFAAGRYNSFNFLTRGGKDETEGVKFYAEEYRKAFLQNVSGAVGSVVKKPA